MICITNFSWANFNWIKLLKSFKKLWGEILKFWIPQLSFTLFIHTRTSKDARRIFYRDCEFILIFSNSRRSNSYASGAHLNGLGLWSDPSQIERIGVASNQTLLSVGRWAPRTFASLVRCNETGEKSRRRWRHQAGCRVHTWQGHRLEHAWERVGTESLFLLSCSQWSLVTWEINWNALTSTTCITEFCLQSNDNKSNSLVKNQMTTKSNVYVKIRASSIYFLFKCQFPKKQKKRHHIII